MLLLCAAFVTCGASVGSSAASAHWASVRSHFPVRVVDRHRIVFLGTRSNVLRARLATHGYRRVQRFSVSEPAALVRIGRHALRGKNGRWFRPRTVRLAATAPKPLPPATPRPASPPPSGTTLPLATPASAAAFINSVGVNVHMSYFSTAYNDWQLVRDKLVELGVHHVRDAACPGCTTQRQRLLALAASGITVDFMMQQPGNSASLQDLVNMVAGPMRSAVDSVEGPNEYDRSGNPTWVTDLRAYQEQLYSLVRSTPALDGVPVIGPSLVGSTSFAALGDLSSAMDWGNAHPYSGGQVPTGTLAYNTRLETAVAQGKPMAATEAGYHNALGATGGQPPVSEEAAADYVPRLFLDMFRAGVPRTYLYELVDERPDPTRTASEDEFGLLRSDFSEKPAFRTLEELLHLTAPVGTIDLAPIHVQVTGPSDLRQLLLQTGPATYALVLWRDVKVWDQLTRMPIAVAPADASVQLGPEIAHAELSYLDDSQPRTAVSGNRFEVALLGDPVVVSLSI
jgi:hypothetical protein